jgi:hypothetical protein
MADLDVCREVSRRRQSSDFRPVDLVGAPRIHDAAPSVDVPPISPTDSSSSRCHRPSSRPCSRVAALKRPHRSEQRSRAPGPTQTTSASSAAPRSCGAIRTPSGGSYRALVRREPERVMAGHARFHGEPGGSGAGEAAGARGHWSNALLTSCESPLVGCSLTRSGQMSKTARTARPP